MAIERCDLCDKDLTKGEEEDFRICTRCRGSRDPSDLILLQLAGIRRELERVDWLAQERQDEVKRLLGKAS